MIIPTEARATIAAYREGRTEKQFIADMWARRVAEHPCKRKARGEWPMKAAVAEPPVSNVTPIRKKRSNGG